MDWIEQLMFTEEDLIVLGFHTVSYIVVIVTGYHLCLNWQAIMLLD